MSTESIYNKRLRPETTFDKIEAVLEQLNLPLNFIEFIRRHRRSVTTAIILLIVGVVAVSLYSSHQKEKIRESVEALTIAHEQDGEKKIVALEEVASEFGSTSAALWAQVEIAQERVAAGEYGKAVERYSNVLREVTNKNPVYPLLVLGKAEALENERSWEMAITEFSILQEIVGFETLGYLGAGRIYRQQGKNEQAVGIYNNFLLKAEGEPRLERDKQVIEAEVSRLKAIIGDKQE